MLTDTHCHIYSEYYDDINEIIKKSEKNSVNRFINNGINLKTSKEILEYAKKYKNMFVVLGLHPEEDLSEVDNILSLIRSEINNKKMIGIGEIGLDYNYNSDNKQEQINVLEKQLSLAQELDLPVVIHSREATGDMLNILKKYNLKGVIHCFNGSVETAREYIRLGYKLGINGVVTFKNCKLIETLKVIGVDSLVFETDSPYLTPTPDRGKKNDPSYTRKIVEFVSNNLNISYDKLVEISNKNIKDVFDI